MLRYKISGIIVICFCIGCLPKASDQLERGPVSIQQLKKQRGNPQSIQQTASGQTVHQYRSGENFQVDQEGQVTYTYRNPTQEEQSLQYWLTRWREQTYHFTAIKENKTHLPESLYYINLDNNERFVYDQAMDKVVRVIFELETERDPTIH